MIRLEYHTDNGDMFCNNAERLKVESRFSDIYMINNENKQYILKCPNPNSYTNDWTNDDWKKLYEIELDKLKEVNDEHIAKPVAICSNINVITDGKTTATYECGLLQQYIDGPLLREALNHEFEIDSACQLSLQIINTIQNINTSTGLYHLDISDSNIKLSNNNSVIIDFTGGYCKDNKSNIIMSSLVEDKLKRIDDLNEEHCKRAQAYMVYKILRSFGIDICDDIIKKYENFDPSFGPSLDDLSNDIERFIKT